MFLIPARWQTPCSVNSAGTQKEVFIVFFFSSRKIVAWGHVALTDWDYMIEADLCSFLPFPPSGRRNEAFMIGSGYPYFALYLMEGHHSSQEGLIIIDFAFPVRDT